MYYKAWYNVGIINIADLLQEGSFLSFNQLTQKYGIEQTGINARN